MQRTLKELGTGARCFQVQLTLTFRRLKLLQRVQDQGITLLNIEFQRNTKSVCTANKLIPPDKSMIVWGESLTVTLTLYQDPSTGKYLQEECILLLKGYTKDKEWTPQIIGTVTLKLNLLAPDLATEKVALRLSDVDGKEVCIIKTAITAKLLREYTSGMDGKNSTPWSPMSLFNWTGNTNTESPGSNNNKASPMESPPDATAISTKGGRERTGSYSSMANIYDGAAASDKYLDETSETFREQLHGRSESPEVFEFIDDEYLLYSGTSKLYLGPGSPSKMSKNALGRVTPIKASSPTSAAVQAAIQSTTDANLADLTRDLKESQESVARLEKEYLRLQSITDVDADMIDQMVKAEIDSLTAAEKQTQQLVRELDIAQSQVHTAVLSIEVQELQAELSRAKEKIKGLQREKDNGSLRATPDHLKRTSSMDASSSSSPSNQLALMAEIAQLKRERYDFESLQTQLTAALERCNRLEIDLRQARQQSASKLPPGSSLPKDQIVHMEAVPLITTITHQLEESQKRVQTQEDVIRELQGKIRDYEQEIEKTKKPTGTQMKSSGGGGGFSPLRASELPVPRTKIPTSLNSTASPVRRPIALSQREDNSDKSHEAAASSSSISNAQKEQYETKIVELEAVIESFIRKLNEARTKEETVTKQLEEMRAAPTSSSVSSNNAEMKIGSFRDSTSPPSSASQNLGQNPGGDRAKLVQELEETRTKLAQGEKLYEQKAIEHDSIIESFVRKLKEARDNEAAAVVKMEAAISASSGTRKITSPTPKSNTGFVSIWR